MTDVKDLITDNIDVWTSAIKKRNSTGRGSNKKIELTGVKKLRELILELAVRGKLVLQETSDEPASVLLEKIAAEKAQLIADKKIKKQKPLPAITDEEKPFELSKGWEWARLGAITNYGTCDKAEPNSVESSTWVLELEDVEKETSKLLKKVRYNEREFKSSKNKFVVGDVIYGKLRPYLDKVIVADESGVCTTEMIPVRAYSAITPEFLRLIMKSPYFIKYANESTHGMNLPRMGTDKAKLALIPIISGTEQHRIVAKVDELMALCDQLEQQTEHSLSAHQTLVEELLNALFKPSDSTSKTKADSASDHTAHLTAKDGGNEENAGAIFFQESWARIADHFDILFTTEHSIEQLKQTILQLAVMGKLVPQNPADEPASVLLAKIAAEKAQLIADKKIKKQKPLPAITDEEKPFELPIGWEYERIGTFGIVGTGSTPSRSNPYYWQPAEYNWVSSGETSDFFVNETKEKVSALAIKETNVSLYPAGTLIVAMYGQGKTRGQITELLNEAGTNQACAAIRLVNDSKNHKDYVKLYFRKAYVELRSHAAGGAQPNLNVGKISNTVLALPPLSEQHRIVAKVDELMTLCDQLKAHLSDAQTTQLHLADAVVEQTLA